MNDQVRKIKCRYNLISHVFVSAIKTRYTVVGEHGLCKQIMSWKLQGNYVMDISFVIRVVLKAVL